MILKYITAAAAAVIAISLPTLCVASPIPIPGEELMGGLMKRALNSVITTCTTPNSFAVTFDDGPGPYTHELLDYLARKRVKVTFFVNGFNYGSITDPANSAALKRAYAEGHQIASHTWSHQDISLAATNLEFEMTNLDIEIEKQIGIRPVYMRPPYGNTSPESIAWLTGKGYKIINWDVDTNDWQHPLDFKASMAAYKTALQGAPSGSKFISLQHDAEQGTSQILSKLAIEYVLSKGYDIMPIAACLGDTTGWYRK
ncbi:chitin deacetylase [Entomortierella beljakovae]|nr:chitin deacetylase [Entomortierella beljakovae]